MKRWVQWGQLFVARMQLGRRRSQFSERLMGRWRRNTGRFWAARNWDPASAGALHRIRVLGGSLGRVAVRLGDDLLATGRAKPGIRRGMRTAVGAGLVTTLLVALVLWGGGQRLNAAQPQSPQSTVSQHNERSRAEDAASRGSGLPTGPHQPRGGVAGLLKLQPGTNYISLEIGGLVRTAIVEVPQPAPDRGRLPMVVAMHGANGTAEDMISTTGLTGPAMAAGIIMVYPQGWNESWNAGGCCGQARDLDVDDMAFLDALIWQLRTDAMAGSVYLTGFSNGGMMAYRYACERIVSGVVVMGASLVNMGCAAPAPVSVLAMHAMPDDVVPYRGGGPDDLSATGWPHIDEVMAYWSANGRCAGHTDSTASSGLFTRTWHGCARGITVEERLSSDGSHLWPTGAGQLNATLALINFVLSHER